MRYKYVCATCGEIYKIKKTGADVIACKNNVPEEIWNVDVWECPKCKHTLLAGFANSPIKTSFMPDFPAAVEACLTKKSCRKFNIEYVKN